MLSLIARWPRTSCSRSARRPARTTSEKSLRSFSQDHFGSKVSRFDRSQASGDESSSLSSFSVARRGVGLEGLEGACGTHADERRATTRPMQIRRMLFRGSRLGNGCRFTHYPRDRANAANRLLRAEDVPAVQSPKLSTQPSRPVDLGLNWELCKWWRHDFKTSFGGQRGTSAVSARSRSSCHKLTRYGCLVSPKYEAS